MAQTTWIEETGMVENSLGTARPSIAVIGAGRVGSTLARALFSAGYPINGVWSRTPAHANALAEHVNARVVDIDELPRMAELVLLAVADDSLASVLEQLAAAGAWREGHLVVHCSGVLPAAVLAPARAQGAIVGGFHPLAAIAGHAQELPRGITFAVEAEEPLREILYRMAHDLGGHPFALEGAARSLYHAAAVLASNYTVVLAALATQLLENAGLEPDAALPAIMPLLESTVANLGRAGLPDALTGPLARGDIGTVMRHLAALDHVAPEIAQIYRALGHAALPMVEARGELTRETVQELEDALHSMVLDAAPALDRVSPTTARPMQQ
jgi:predicted short-subunit dehydrogenase-like oxidoreductase (DUF2520 family)